MLRKPQYWDQAKPDFQLAEDKTKIECISALSPRCLCTLWCRLQASSRAGVRQSSGRENVYLACTFCCNRMPVYRPSTTQVSKGLRVGDYGSKVNMGADDGVWQLAAGYYPSWRLLSSVLVLVIFMPSIALNLGISRLARDLDNVSFQRPSESSEPSGTEELTSCPYFYPRHTIDDIQHGALPYLFGGSPEPCQSCRRGDIADFCQFIKPPQAEHRAFQHTAHLCSHKQHRGIIEYLMQHDLYDYLQFTPCDLWPFLRGRTLWIIGDSQVKTNFPRCIIPCGAGCIAGFLPELNSMKQIEACYGIGSEGATTGLWASARILQISVRSMSYVNHRYYSVTLCISSHNYQLISDHDYETPYSHLRDAEFICYAGT